MARFTMLSLLLVTCIFSLVPSSQAGPACARRNSGSGRCSSRCNGKWGYPGRVMGSNPWGPVMTKGSTDLNDVLTKACKVKSSSSVSSSSAAATTTGAPVNVGGALPVFATSGSAVITTSSPPASPKPSSISSELPSSSSSFSSIHSTPASHALKVTSSSKAPEPVPTKESPKPAPPPPSPSPEQPKTSSKEPEPTPEPTPEPKTTTSAPAPKPTTSSVPVQNDTPPSSGATSSSDIQQYLSAHNTIRAQHGASALTWSDNLASKAQQWANNCVFKHSGGSLGPFGENLAAGTGSAYGIAEAVKSWTDEVSEYDSSNPQPSHFTQVVWKASTQVGCAVQSCNGIFDASFGPAKFYVCEYSPQGNVIGEFAQNVQA